MARKTPIIRDTELFFYDENRAVDEVDVFLCDIVKDWGTWQERLEAESVFRFIGPDGASCSIRKELRPHFGTAELRPVWYAHKRIKGKLYKKYLGKNDSVDYQKLREATHWLYNKKLPM